jgi:hypothetical protein
VRYGEDAYAGDAAWASEGPCVRVFSPGPGEVTSRATEFYFEVRDLLPFTLVLRAHVRGQAAETIFDGTDFLPLYATSTRAALAVQPSDQMSGWAFTIRRLGGWQAGVRFEILVEDGEGNEAVIGGGPIPIYIEDV